MHPSHIFALASTNYDVIAIPVPYLHFIIVVLYM